MSSARARSCPALPGHASRLLPAGTALLSAAVALLAGCSSSNFGDGAQALRVDLASHSVRTGEQLRLAATAAATGEPAQVRWHIAGSDNAAALGQGSISADGIYTPPAMLSRDVVSVAISASVSAPGAGLETAMTPVTTTLSVLPGFVQPLQPENATLFPATSLQVRAQLAEVGSGSVTWTITSASGARSEALGTLSNQHCEIGLRQFTACSVTYTAPQAAPAGALIWLTATTRPPAGLLGVSVRARLILGELSSNPARHQSQQPGPVALGGSGGSDNDFDTYRGAGGTRFVADCCGGTLGSLVEDQFGTPFILSNNHVLAASDQGRTGDTIEQPALIDDGCVPLSQAGAQMQAVGTLRYAVPLNTRTSNVDAALASVHAGAVDPSGAVLELGSTAADGSLRNEAPVAGQGEVLDAARLSGLAVVKSGRTTGLTCSTVDAVDLRVKVEYYKDCAETQPYTTKTFTGQLGIGGEAFADSGDSGALVVDAANAQAVGLLYATGTAGVAGAPGLTLANPIADVLRELSLQSGSPLRVRGTSTPHKVSCLDYDRPQEHAALTTLAPDERTRVTAAVETAGALRSARVLAIVAGVSADAPAEGAVLLYVDRSQPALPLPTTIGGVRTVIVPSDFETIVRGPAAWPSPSLRPGLRLTAAGLAGARATVERLAPSLMEVPGVFGAGVTQSLDNPDEAALLVLLDSDAPRLGMERELSRLAGTGEPDGGDAGRLALPAILGGMRVRYMSLHRLRVTQSKYVARGAPSSCAPRTLSSGQDPAWSPSEALQPSPFR